MIANRYKYQLNTENAVLVELESGKPSANGRVGQAAQKGDTCHYYTMNYLRDRIGKSASPHLENKRALEKLLSKHRKELTKLTIVRACEWSIANTAVVFISQNPEAYKSIDAIQLILAKTFQVLMQDAGFYTHFAHTNGYPLKKEYVPYMMDFIKQIKDTYKNYLAKGYEQERLFDLNYLTDLKQANAFIEFYQNCFKELGLDIEEQYRLYRESCVNIPTLLALPESMNDLEDSSKAMVLHTMYNDRCAQLNNLKLSDWHPDAGIDALMNVLREHGPVMTSGYLGAFYYEPDSTVNLTIGAIQATGFKPNTANITDISDSHVVLVVGVTKKGYENSSADLVYFVDPKVPQQPDQPVQIFAVSYNTFTRRLIERHGVKTNGAADTWSNYPGARFFHYRGQHNEVVKSVAPALK